MRPYTEDAPDLGGFSAVGPARVMARDGAMTHWRETRLVLDRWAALARDGGRAVLCTVIAVRGSAYRHEGAKLLLAEDGQTTGSVSAGCVEQDLREVGRRVMTSGLAQVRTYAPGDDPPWGLGLGCDGEVDILIEPAAQMHLRSRPLLEGRVPFAVARLLPDARVDPLDHACRWLLVSPDGTQGSLGAAPLDQRVAHLACLGKESSVHRQDGLSIFTERFTPPPRLVMFGAGDDAQPVAELATRVGFQVVVADRRRALLAGGRFPQDTIVLHSGAPGFVNALALDDAQCAVVMTHDFQSDKEAVELLLRSAVPYVGLLGPAIRTRRMTSELLREARIDKETLDRVHAPVGIPIGAEGAEQVAISIVADLLAARGSWPQSTLLSQ
jgi:xanthine dehydrogenase accessory factor